MAAARRGHIATGRAVIKAPGLFGMFSPAPRGAMSCTPTRMLAAKRNVHTHAHGIKNFKPVARTVGRPRRPAGPRRARGGGQSLRCGTTGAQMCRRHGGAEMWAPRCRRGVSCVGKLLRASARLRPRLIVGVEFVCNECGFRALIPAQNAAAGASAAGSQTSCARARHQKFQTRGQNC